MPGVVVQGTARLGWATHSAAGPGDGVGGIEAGIGKAGLGVVWFGSGRASSGWVRHGVGRLGKARRVSAWQVMVRQCMARFGGATYSAAGPGDGTGGIEAGIGKVGHG